MKESKSISEEFKLLQDRICERIETIDKGAKFAEDLWDRTEGGGGRTRILSEGNVIEKGGVNFSFVHGEVTQFMKQNTEIDAEEFSATGVSIVIHPNNPHVPIIHMNVRYFELSDGKYWFGGGIDLTPHYVVETQAGEFHRGLRKVCDKYDANFYPKFKQWADDYFFVTHRNETRGIGGIFFDHLDESCGLSKKKLLEFCVELGDVFADLYEYQVIQGQNKEVIDEQIAWMQLRRGRYVEFNLVHDRGTKFGLVSGGRIESILMSLPKTAGWEYNNIPEKNSAEDQTVKSLIKGVNWVDF